MHLITGPRGRIFTIIHQPEIQQITAMCNHSYFDNFYKCINIFTASKCCRTSNTSQISQLPTGVKNERNHRHKTEQTKIKNHEHRGEVVLDRTTASRILVSHCDSNLRGLLRWWGSELEHAGFSEFFSMRRREPFTTNDTLMWWSNQKLPHPVTSFWLLALLKLNNKEKNTVRSCHHQRGLQMLHHS